LSIDLSTKTEERLLAAARAEGVSVDTLVQRLIAEREEFAELIERAAAHAGAVSREQVQAKIERGFAQSERGEVVDGEVFTAGLLDELDEMERKRRAG
jgi:hypothetical protein